MAKIKWIAKEYTPTAEQLGQHGWYAEAKINDILDTNGLAQKVSAASGFKSYEVEAIIKAIADQVFEECLESNRVILQGSKNDSLVAFYPKVDGRINDEEATEAAGEPTVATEEMLNNVKKSASIQASVGINVNKQFALDARFEKEESANFNPPAPGQYRVSLSQNPSNSGATLTGAGNYDAGDSVTVTTTVPSGKTFDGWYSGSTLVSSNTSYTFTINANTSLVAKFSSGSVTTYPLVGMESPSNDTHPTFNGVTVTSRDPQSPTSCGNVSVGDTITVNAGTLQEANLLGIKYRTAVTPNWTWQTISGTNQYGNQTITIIQDMVVDGKVFLSIDEEAI